MHQNWHHGEYAINISPGNPGRVGDITLAKGLSNLKDNCCHDNSQSDLNYSLAFSAPHAFKPFRTSVPNSDLEQF
jgi:hypothetical protein